MKRILLALSLGFALTAQADLAQDISLCYKLADLTEQIAIERDRGTDIYKVMSSFDMGQHKGIEEEFKNIALIIYSNPTITRKDAREIMLSGCLDQARERDEKAKRGVRM